MDGKEESLCTVATLFGFCNYVCNGKPPDKAGTFLMANKINHTNEENIALRTFNVDVLY